MTNKLFFAFSLSLTAFTAPAQTPVPGAPQQAPVLILGATAHLGNGTAIPNSAIAFDQGKITMVADATTIRIDRRQFGKIFDASGKHVYPGFIAADSRLGLVEIEAVRATRDFSETGSINPNARAIVAYNADSEVIPTVRTNGVLLAQVTPAGGLVSGTSAVVQLDAWNWEDAAVRADDGIHLNWPNESNRPRGRGRRPDAGTEGGANPYEQAVTALNDYFAEAKAYAQKSGQAPTNPRFEAMRGLFDQKIPLYLHVNQAKGIMESVLFAEKYGVRPVIVGGNDAWRVTDFLKQHEVPVILNKTQRLPSREEEDIDQPYKTPALLHEAGVLFCLSEEGGWRQRNLPFEAGQATGYGLPYEAAVQSITLNAARILGISDRTGSLETGKDATLFIADGDALDMRTCQVTAAFIQGREVNLDDKHKDLYRKFEEKYKRQ